MLLGKKCWIALIAVTLFALVLTEANLFAENKDPAAGNNGNVPPLPPREEKKQNQQNKQNPPVKTDMKEVDVKWRTDKLKEAFELARKENKFLFIYFIFSELDKCPPIYDGKISAYSRDKAVFIKIHVETVKGEIKNKNIAEFFERYQLEKEGVAVVLDQHRNFIAKLPVPAANSKLLALLEKSEQAIEETGKNLKKQWEKAVKLKKGDNKKELIRELNKIIQTNQHGYEEFANAKKELETLNEPFKTRLKEIIKQYIVNGKDKEDTIKETIEQMEMLIKDCKELPAEADIQNAIAKIKKGEAFPDEEKEAEESKVKAEEKEAPPEINIDDLLEEPAADDM